jgi:hypothetical protein
MMKGCLKLGGDPVLDRGVIEILRNIPEKTVIKIIEKNRLKEFRVDWPLASWPKPRCSACDKMLYSAETFEQQMCWTHIHSSLVVDADEKLKKQSVYLLCRECADKINYDRFNDKNIDDFIG